MLIIEDLTVTVKCRTAIKGLLLYFNLCLSLVLDSLSCSFTSISFLTTNVIKLGLCSFIRRFEYHQTQERVFMCLSNTSTLQVP